MLIMSPKWLPSSHCRSGTACFHLLGIIPYCFSKCWPLGCGAQAFPRTPGCCLCPSQPVATSHGPRLPFTSSTHPPVDLVSFRFWHSQTRPGCKLKLHSPPPQGRLYACDPVEKSCLLGMSLVRARGDPRQPRLRLAPLYGRLSGAV